MKFWCPNYASYSTGDRWFVPGSGNPWTNLYFWQGHECGDKSVVHLKARPSGGCFYGGYYPHKLDGINVWYPGDKSVEDRLPKPGWDFGLSNSSLCYHNGMFCYVHIGTMKSYWGQAPWNNFEAWYDIQYEITTGALKSKYFEITEYGDEAVHPEDWDYLKSVLFGLIDLGTTTVDGYQHVGWSSPLGVESPNGKLPPTVTTLFGEISGITTSGSPFSNVLQHTVEEAFVNATAGAPRMNSNNITNLKEIISFGKSFLNGDWKHAMDDFNDFSTHLRRCKNVKRFMKKYRIKSGYNTLKLACKQLKRRNAKAVISGVKNAWLAYRYSYSTSKSDAEELGGYIDFLASSIDQPVHKLYGFAQSTYDNVAYRVTFKTSLVPLNFRNTESYLLEYGLLPTPYVLWDMVPFSFVVDWFAPIGDMLESIDNIDFVNSAYELTQQTASVDYTMTAGDYQVHVYARWLTAITHVDASALARMSNPITIKRIADGLALIRK